MIFKDGHLIQPIQEVNQRQEESELRKARMSKLKSLTNQVQNLLQKKVRIDLEIRATRRKLLKLKQSSMLKLKEDLQSEGFDLSQGPISVQTLNEAVGPELTEELIDFDTILYEADHILSLVNDLPLYQN